MHFIVRIERENPEAWALMPQLFDRIALFCEKYDPETLTTDLVDLVRVWFMSGDRRLGLWVTVDDSTIVGHLLATPEPFTVEQWRYMLIRQAEIDKGYDLREEADQIFNACLTWSKSIGLKRVVMVTHRSQDAMSRAWGFQRYKAIMSREID